MKFKSAPPIPENGRLKTIATGTAEVFKLDPRCLTRAPGFNTRYDFGDIAALAADIEANGILEALKVRKEGTAVFIVNGDRRLTAIELLIRENRWPEDPARPGFPMPVPCTSEGKGISPTDRIFMMLSLNTGKPFNLLEKAYAYNRILEENRDINAAEIARRTGETKQSVSNALTLVRKAGPDLIRHIKGGHLAPTTALEIAKAHEDHASQSQAANAAIQAAASNGRNHATPKDLLSRSAGVSPASSSEIRCASQTDTQTPDTDPFIADLSDEHAAGPESTSHSSHPSPTSHSSTSPDAPADPTAIERLKSAPSTNRDGSSGGPGSGYASCDKRLKKVEELLDSIDPTEVNQNRWNTVELFLDYLNGNHTVATLRAHLTEVENAENPKR